MAYTRHIIIIIQIVLESCSVVSESFIERGSTTEENALHTFARQKRVARHRGAGLTSQTPSGRPYKRLAQADATFRVWRSLLELKSNNIGEPLLLCIPATYLVKALCRFIAYALLPGLSTRYRLHVREIPSDSAESASAYFVCLGEFLVVFVRIFVIFLYFHIFMHKLLCWYAFHALCT